MQNINKSENETLSSSFVAVSIIEPTSMKSQDNQLKKDSASQNVSGTTIKRPYGSILNLTAAAITTGGYTTAILQTPTAVMVQQVSTELIGFCPTLIELANYAGPRIHELLTAEVETDRGPSRLIGRFLQQNQTVMARANRTLRAEISPVVLKDCGVQCRTLHSITRTMCFMIPKSSVLLRCKYHETRRLVAVRL